MLMPANPFQRVFGEVARKRLRMAAAGRSARQQGHAPALKLIVIRRAAKGKEQPERPAAPACASPASTAG